MFDYKNAIPERVKNVSYSEIFSLLSLNTRWVRVQVNFVPELQHDFHYYTPIMFKYFKWNLKKPNFSFFLFSFINVIYFYCTKLLAHYSDIRLLALMHWQKSTLFLWRTVPLSGIWFIIEQSAQFLGVA